MVLGLRANAVQVNAWNKQNGFDRPVIEQYLSYMNDLLHGNLGFSYAENQPVTLAVRRAPGPQHLPVRHIAAVRRS